MVSDIISSGKDDYFGRFYVVMKVDLDENSYECIYSHSREVSREIPENGLYGDFVKNYIEKFVHEKDQSKLKSFLALEGTDTDFLNGCLEEDIQYRRREKLKSDHYVWMDMKKYIDRNIGTMILTFHNSKVIFKTLVNMEKELRKKESDIEKQYWDMVSLLVSVLNHNNLMEKEHQDDISFYTEKVYRQLQKNCPEYGIEENEIKNVSHLAPIHDIGKIKVPMEIINKPGKLTSQEMEIMKQHPLTGAEMTLRFPEGVTTEKLNRYSYDICKYHHERYDGNGYPDGLKGDEIPLCAQVVGLVDAYDALISDRPYKRKLKHEEAIRMIVNGECGVFSKKQLCCFLAAAMQPEWMQKVNAQE